MKHFNKTVTYCIVMSLVLCSCQKSFNSQPYGNRASSVNSNAEAPLSTDTLILRPGPDDGQDVYVYKKAGVEPRNWNSVPELNANAWKIYGNKSGSGSFIKFGGLSAIPLTATVTSAKLYLYGLSSSLSTPQGDSGENACYIRRVLDPWDESDLEFSNILPKSTDEGQAILPASTSQWNYNAVVDVTAMVEYMVTHPNENHGFSISLITQEKYRSIVFGSSEQPDKSLRPKLVIVYENIGNPLAGPYLWDFTRWNCQDSTLCDRDILLSFTGEQTLFVADDATTIEVPSGYFILPRYVITFDNNGGVLSNLQLSMNADDVAAMAAAGVTIVDGPNILMADPISQTFEFQYTVLNASGYRYIVDKYYKP